ncbi:MAG: PIN domain-containing protein [Candidatus Micrarchaeota archaeon]
MEKKKYYFDTSIWIARLCPGEFYHDEAVKWFEKAEEENAVIVVSDVIIKEIRGKGEKIEFLFETLCLKLSNSKKVEFVETNQSDEKHAYEISENCGFPKKDTVHILTAKRHGLIAVTADITHWPKIAREVGYSVIYVTEVFPASF